MLQQYSLRLRIYSWFMKYMPLQWVSAGIIVVFLVVTLVGTNNCPPRHNKNRDRAESSKACERKCSPDNTVTVADRPQQCICLN
jgi:hypothetical protein